MCVGVSGGERRGACEVEGVRGVSSESVREGEREEREREEGQSTAERAAAAVGQGAVVVVVENGSFRPNGKRAQQPNWEERESKKRWEGQV